MSRYGPSHGRVQHNTLSFPSTSRSTTTTKSTSPLRSMAEPSGSPKSLTPQRKHHKLLKDGSEVWSEDVEKVFVEGLREYWESPWATYSRGRSRWRNQFLVDHLKKFGIERSKKQVASHIQVLRNMWRGEPEFHLVAGGEELFMENGLLASPTASTSASATPDPPESSSRYDSLDDLSSSSASSTPDSMTPDFTQMHSSAIPMNYLSPTGSNMGLASLDLGPFSSRSAPSVLDYPYPPSSSSPPAHLQAGVKLEPLHATPGLYNLPPITQSAFPESVDFATSFPLPPPLPRHRVTKLSLWADGMVPFEVDVDRLALTGTHRPDHTSVLIRIKLSISSIDDIHSSPNLHGFQGTMTFSEPWNSDAKCITKSYAGPACMSSEIGSLEATSSPAALSNTAWMSQGYSTALPDSCLTRCKWLETSQDTITQQIVFNEIVVAAFVFHLERTVVSGSPPSAELVAFQKYKPDTRRRHLSQPQFALSPQTAADTNNLPHVYFSNTSAAYSGAGVSPDATLLSRPPMDTPMTSALSPNRIPGVYSPAKMPSGDPAHSAFYPQP
ncbi:hypothetical protein NLI96_g9231 [Meripilus lineatus]|uniref:TEA domain-containing protein n=1 Tax=Meripilus lineatus TaxID=2056292 RepID=A0AAD5V0J7_9APHY|nr:hypothetical protein NLI96_g9231 [Physisporinus lineatus]